MKSEVILSHENFTSFTGNESLAVIYFSTLTCNVCKALKPKLKGMLDDKFPKFVFGYVDCEKEKGLAVNLNIFTVPTIIFLFEGNELIRKFRNINFSLLEEELNRPYSLCNS